MSRTGAFLLGALGGLLPLMVTLLAIDIAPIIDNPRIFSVGNWCGYGIKVLVLVLLGGIVALLNSEVKQPFALVQLGIAAPALVTSFINGASGKPPNNQTASYSIVSMAHAQDGSSSQLKRIQVADFWRDVGAGITTRLDNLAVQKLPQPQKLPDPIAATPAPTTSDRQFWVDTGTLADWAGRDIASTSGPMPKFEVSNKALCDESGQIAVCWDNRITGFPRNVPTDLAVPPTPQWCTYKSSTVRITTPPDGAAPGRVYLCARSAAKR